MSDGVRKAVVELTGDSKRLDGVLTSSGRRVDKWGKKVAGDIRGAMRGAFSGMSGIAGFAGIAGLGLAAKHVMDFEERVTRLGITGRMAAAPLAALKAQLFAVAQMRGVDAGALLGGLEVFVAKTGDIKGAAAAMDVFAMVAQATGANLEDVARAGAGLRTSLGITSAQDMAQALATLAMQGKSGAVELKELAAEVAGLAPQFSKFGTTGAAAVAEMGAMLQIGQRGFGTASEAATGFSSLMGSLLKKQKQIRALGVKMFDVGPDGKKKLRDIKDIIFQIAEKTKGDPLKIQALLNDKESIRFFDEIMKAGPEGLARLMAEQKAALQELKQDAETVARTPAAKARQAKALLDKSLNELLAKHLPDLVKGITLFAKAVSILVADLPEFGAAFLAFKAGGYLGGLGGAGGGLLSRGATPAATGGGLAAPAATAGAGLARFAGQLQLASIALGIGVVAIEGFFDYLNSKVDKKNKNLESDVISGKSHYGRFGLERAWEVFGGEKSNLDTFRRPGFLKERQDKATDAKRLLLEEAVRGGTVKIGPGGEYQAQSKDLVGKDANLSRDEKTAVQRALEIALADSKGTVQRSSDPNAYAPVGAIPPVMVMLMVDPVTGKLFADAVKPPVVNKRHTGGKR